MEILQICNRFQIKWRLFGAKTAVKIRPDGNVPRVAREFTDMFDVVARPRAR